MADLAAVTSASLCVVTACNDSLMAPLISGARKPGAGIVPSLSWSVRPGEWEDLLHLEQLDYNLLFRWFVRLNMDEAVWDATTFTKNRDRLLDGDMTTRPPPKR